jgi:hypothetical protein
MEIGPSRRIHDCQGMESAIGEAPRPICGGNHASVDMGTTGRGR